MTQNCDAMLLNYALSVSLFFNLIIIDLTCILGWFSSYSENNYSCSLTCIIIFTFCIISSRKKKLKVNQSIHFAYETAIGSAHPFHYIEEYFDAKFIKKTTVFDAKFGLNMFDFLINFNFFKCIF